MRDPVLQSIAWRLSDIKSSFGVLNFLLAWIAVELTILVFMVGMYIL